MPSGMRATSPQNCLSFGDTGGNQLPVISQLFLLLKLIKAFLIHNQYIKVPLFYKTVHQYFMVLIIYVLLQKQMEPYSTHVLERVNRGERKPELQILGFSNQPFWAPDSNSELWEAEWWLEGEPHDQTLQEGGSGSDYFLTISPMSVITLSTLSWWSKRRLEKNFQTQSIAQRSEFIKNKEQRQCGQWEHGRPTPSDMPGRVDPLHGLVANFSSLKTNKIPAGRVALGGYLGHFCLNAPNLGVRRLAGKDHGDFWQWFQWGSVSFRDDLISPCPWPWCKASCVWARIPLHKLDGCYIISSP